MNDGIAREDVLEIRNSSGVALLLLASSAGLVSLLLFWEPSNRPFVLTLAVVTAALGLWRLLDRRARLEISASGILYRDWSTKEIRWDEFTGYDRVSWRNNTYIQLAPKRPERLMTQLSPTGRLNRRAGRLIGLPEFSIAVAPLAVSDRVLEDVIAQHIPRVPISDR